jgi:hypothetical protein
MLIHTRGLFAATAAIMVTLVGCGPESTTEPLSADLAVVPSFARAVVFPGGCCFYEGREVRTVVPPAASPQQGRDNFYGFPQSAAVGQKGVVAVAPGDTDYHGGQWAFHAVTWNVSPYLLTSEAAVLAARDAGDLTVTRVAQNDFKCPIQP